MKALVIGADGLIGNALVEALRRRGDVVFATTRRKEINVRDGWLHLDLIDPQVSSGYLPQAEVAFICAAMTKFADCRANPELAYRTNVAGPTTLGAALAARNTRVVLLSTSAVFDCRTPKMSTHTPTSPTTVYGSLKAEAETRILSLSPANAVVRLTKVLSPASSLLRGWIRALQRHEPIQAFSDHRISPITLDYALAGLLAVADRGEGRIYHLSGAADISYAEIARVLANHIGAAATLVQSINAVDAGIPPEEVTAFTSLDPGLLSALIGAPPPDPISTVESVLEAFLIGDGNPELPRPRRHRKTSKQPSTC